jgi:hypothetical protein
MCSTLRALYAEWDKQMTDGLSRVPLEPYSGLNRTTTFSSGHLEV